MGGEEQLERRERGTFEGPFFSWTPSDAPFRVEAVNSDFWDQIHTRYNRALQSSPTRRISEVLSTTGAKTCVTEYRYIDADYRSEHAAFYSGTFVRYPSVCHRLHFFSDDFESIQELDSTVGTSYLGYVVMRPLPDRPIGRTLLRPPPGANYCWSEETVHLFGLTLTIRGMPYISQDAQYTRCAHSTIWMVLRHASNRSRLTHVTPVEVHEATAGGRVVGRETPSDGLSPEQVLSGLHKLGISAAYFDIKHDATPPKKRSRFRRSTSGNTDDKFAQLLVPYINSQIPPLVYSDNHIWVVVGYHKVDGRIRFIIHDDSEGPYLDVDPKVDHGDRSPWLVALPPMPKKLYLTAERAEALAVDVISGVEDLAAATAWDELLPESGGDDTDKPSEDLFLRAVVDRVRQDTVPSRQDIDLLDESLAASLEELRSIPSLFTVSGPEGTEISLFESQVRVFEKLNDLSGVSWRTYAIDSETFKASTVGRLPDAISTVYRMLPLPRHVWIVEVVDSELRSGDTKMDVIGEVLLDGTAHQRIALKDHSAALAIHLWGLCTTVSIDHRTAKTTSVQMHAPYASGTLQTRIGAELELEASRQIVPD